MMQHYISAHCYRIITAIVIIIEFMTTPFIAVVVLWEFLFHPFSALVFLICLFPTSNLGTIGWKINTGEIHKSKCRNIWHELSESSIKTKADRLDSSKGIFGQWGFSSQAGRDEDTLIASLCPLFDFAFLPLQLSSGRISGRLPSKH